MLKPPTMHWTTDRRFAPRAVVTLLLWALAAAPLQARTSDREMETEVKAGSVVEDPDAGTQEFSNGFQLSQGTRQIEAETATVFRNDSGGFRKIILRGDPARWTEELDDGTPMDASANTIEYDVSGEIVRLTGDVSILKANDQLTASEVLYDLKTQKLDAGGSEQGVILRYKPTGDDNGDDN